MLISCFQCRKQLEVPDDSAGKRVRCPQCQHVIVVPGRGLPDGAALALPSLELDEGTPTTAPVPKPATTNIPPVYPLPPIELPAHEPKPTSRSSEPAEEVPSIERGGRRRGATKPQAEQPRWMRPQTRWGRSMAIGVIVGAGLCVVIACLMSMDWGPKRQPPRFAHRPPPPPAVVPNPPQFDMPKIEFPPIENPPFVVPPIMLQWQDHVDAARRFRCQMPGQPVQRQQDQDGVPMTVFEVQQAEWEFAVAHGTLTDQQVKQVPLEQRYGNIERSLSNRVNGFRIFEQLVTVGPSRQGKEWWIRHDNHRRWYVRVFFAQEGENWHQYFVMAKGPLNGVIPTDRNHLDITRFFNSFVISINSEALVGNVVVEELDDLNAGARRDTEFTTFARHPAKPIIVLGTTTGAVKVMSTADRASTTFVANAGKPVEHVGLSRDGRWLASVAGGEIQVWENWEGLANKVSTTAGSACAFTKDDRLLIATRNAVVEFDPQTELIELFVDLPFAADGMTLSADGGRLAAFGEKTITVLDASSKKKLAHFEKAHTDPITSLAFAPGGKSLASADADRVIKLWDLDTGKERAALRQHAWTVAGLAFAPNGKHLASVGVDGMLLVWDVQPASPTLVWAQTHRFPVRAVAWDENGKHLHFTCKRVTAGPNEGRQYMRQLRKVAWTDVKANSKAAEKTVAERAGLHLPSSMSSFLFVGDALLTTSGTMENGPDQRKTRLWDRTTGRLQRDYPVAGEMAPSPDGKWLLYTTPGLNGKRQLTLMDAATGRAQPRRVPVDLVSLGNAIFTPEGNSFWVLQKHEYVRYEVPTLNVQQRLKLKEPTDSRILQVTLSSDRQTFLVASTTPGGLRKRTLYATADGSEVPLPKFAPGEPSRFLSIRRNGSLVEWNDTLQGVSQVIGQQKNAMNTWAIRPDRKLAATDEANNAFVKVHLWDLVERRPVLTIGDRTARTITGLRFSRDGRLLAYSTSNGWTRVVPMDWLMERKELLASNNEVGPP